MKTHVRTLGLIVFVAATVLVGCPAPVGPESGDGGSSDPATYTVGFDSNGGSAVPSQTVNEGGQATEPVQPTRSRFDFDGWFTDGTFATAWNFATDTVSADITLVARWAESPFVSTWQTNASGDDTVSGTDQVRFPLDPDGTYNFTIDWGDGTESQVENADIVVLNATIAYVQHTYPLDGIYNVSITGQIEGFGFGFDFSNSTDADKLIDVGQWGSVILRNDRGAFFDADNLAGFTATDTPDLSSITDMGSMFAYTALFNADMSDWDTSGVTNMGAMFQDSEAFSGDISGWDTSQVTVMEEMFSNATSFNADISSWDTSEVVAMENMFYNAAAFNQDLSSWCVSNFASEPTGFDGEAFNWVLPRPVWGTCP